jgi:hypothetical protein
MALCDFMRMMLKTSFIYFTGGHFRGNLLTSDVERIVRFSYVEWPVIPSTSEDVSFLTVDI